MIPARGPQTGFYLQFVCEIEKHSLSTGASREAPVDNLGATKKIRDLTYEIQQ